MSTTETAFVLRRIAASQFDLPIEAVLSYLRIDDVLNFDSMKVLQYVLAVESQFNVTLDDAALHPSTLLAFDALAEWLTEELDCG